MSTFQLYASKSIEQLMFESQQLCPLARDEGVEVAIAREEADVIQDAPEHPIYHLLNSLHHRHIIAEYNPVRAFPGSFCGVMCVGEINN